MSFRQGQAEQQDKLDAQSQMATCLYPFIFLSSLFFSVVFAFVRMPQLILYHVLDNSISCQNVTSLYLFSPHSVAVL